jgi:hypothetical protein
MVGSGPRRRDDRHDRLRRRDRGDLLRRRGHRRHERGEPGANRRRRRRDLRRHLHRRRIRRARRTGRIGSSARPSERPGELSQGAGHRVLPALAGVLSFECAPGSYCAAPDPEAGGTPQCVPLVPVGQPCGAAGDVACSYLGAGSSGSDPKAFCDLQDLLDGGVTCQPVLSPGTVCTGDFVHLDQLACAAGICGDDWQCGSALTFPEPSQCQLYERP